MISVFHNGGHSASNILPVSGLVTCHI